MKRFIFYLILVCLFSAQVFAYTVINSAELEKQIAAGLDVNFRDENGDTLLLWSVKNNQDLDTIRQIIIAGADVNAPSTSDGLTPLVAAVMSAKQTTAEVSENSTNSAQTRQLNESISKKEEAERVSYALDIVRLLIELGADVNQETPFGTPLMVASENDANTEIVAYLLANGADVNLPNHFGRTAIFYAAAHNCNKISTQLLAAGADINVKDIDGKTYMEVNLENLNN